MPWRSALNAKTKMVETMTDTKGAPAETQNNFGFFVLYYIIHQNQLSFVNQTKIILKWSIN